MKITKENITEDILQQLQSSNGGYDRGTLALLGVPWPPPKGWKKKLLNGSKIRAAKSKKSGRKRQEVKNRVSQFYRSYEWAQLRYDAMKINNGCCELCGRSKQDGAVLHVDHIKPIRNYWHLRDKLSNLQVLCSTCNWGKGNRDETDWREPDVRVLMGEKTVVQ